MKSRLKVLMSVLLAVLATSGCSEFEDGMRDGLSSSKAPSSGPASPSSTAPNSPVASKSSEATEAPSAEPTTETSSTAPELTGFGATVEDWESEHGDSVEGYTDGTVYGPIVREGVHKYVGVIAEDRIYSYSRGFPVGTDLSSAERLILQDFPADARITARDSDEVSCLIVLVKSRTIRRATGADAIVAFFTQQDPIDDARTPLNRSDVSDATVFSSDEPGPDLGFC